MNRVIVLMLALLLAVALACAQAEEEPTTDSLPSAPGASPLPDTGTGPSPIVTRASATPAPTDIPPMVITPGPSKYEDPRYKYSIEIPEGFYGQSEPTGGYLSITNYNPEVATEPYPTGKDIKVELFVFPQVKEPSIDDWLNVHDSDSETSRGGFVLDGENGIQRTVRSSAPGTAAQYIVMRGADIYLTNFHYSEQGQLGEVSEMLNSFRFNN